MAIMGVAAIAVLTVMCVAAVGFYVVMNVASIVVSMVYTCGRPTKACCGRYGRVRGVRIHRIRDRCYRR